MKEVLVIVGAGQQLGRSIARRFLKDGVEVALIARRPAPLKMLATQLKAQAFPADASQPHSLRAAFATIRDVLGHPTILVYNASDFVDGTPSALSHRRFMEGLAVGVGGAVIAAQEVFPAMRDAGKGTIMISGSGAALHPGAAFVGLAAQKAAVRAFAIGLAEEAASAGVHATTVTISGVITAGTHFDPDRIAEKYWSLHHSPREQWRPEVIYQRKPQP